MNLEDLNQIEVNRIKYIKKYAIFVKNIHASANNNL